MMSLRGIHFVFILASIVLSGMVALWSFNMYLVSDTSLGYLVFFCHLLKTFALCFQHRAKRLKITTARF